MAWSEAARAMRAGKLGTRFVKAYSGAAKISTSRCNLGHQFMKAKTTSDFKLANESRAKLRSMLGLGSK